MSQPHLVDASGSLITVNKAAKAKMKSCLLTITPHQSGTGDPSPENIRPISGISSDAVYVAPTSDPSDPDKVTYPITIPTPPGTVFGGEIDYTAGKLKITGIKEVFDGVNKKVSSVSLSASSGYYYCTFVPENKIKNNEVLLCNMLWYQEQGEPVLGNIYHINNGNILAYLPDQTLDTKSKVDTWLQSNNLEIFHAIATPEEYNLSDLTDIETIEGVNNVWADDGELTVKYWGF